MTSIASLFRIVGVSIPFGSSVVQQTAELDAHAIQKRLLQLEDPTSTLHPDVREVSRLVYAERTDSGDGLVPDEVMERHSRAFAMLEASGCIKGFNSSRRDFSPDFVSRDPRT